MSRAYDVVIIGAGSIGVPTALELARSGQRVLVLDSLDSPGQGENKKAIGGVRATHSDGAKIAVCRQSIEIMSAWRAETGDDIHWQSNGYSFPAWTKAIERKLKKLMKVQHEHGLNIRWVEPEEYAELNPGINLENLRGSTFSPEDGSAMPLLYIESAYFQAVRAGAEFRFKETVTGLELDGEKITGVRTDKGRYTCGQVLNAAGSFGREMAELAGAKLPVHPDIHEAAISEPVKPFMGPMVVDIRKRPGSANFYFYQAKGGQIVFCMTPDPPILGVDTRSTSPFLIQVAKRLIEVMPKLVNLRVRRTWRGMYPMTPDGFPIVGPARGVRNLYLAIGMCGQGFMLGPGLGRLLARELGGSSTPEDQGILHSFDPYRDYRGMEAFK